MHAVDKVKMFYHLFARDQRRLLILLKYMITQMKQLTFEGWSNNFMGALIYRVNTKDT